MLSLHDRLYKQTIPPERWNYAVPDFRKIVQIEGQPGDAADINVKGCCLTERRRPGRIDQKMLTGSATAFKCNP